MRQRRTAIWDPILWSEGVKTSQIYRRMTVKYDNCTSQLKLYECVERFNEVRTSVVDNASSGLPKTVTCIEVEISVSGAAEKSTMIKFNLK
jgi:hypothetical protein